MRLIKRKTVLAGGLACFTLLLSGCGSGGDSPTPPAQSKKPHVIVVLADDLGWANVGWHKSTTGNMEASTPVMDSLVRSGIELDRHYAFMYCSPSRSALQSGRHPIHVNVVNTDPSYWNPGDNVSGFAGISRNMTGLGQVMKNGGYRTHFVGKWDVGMATSDHTPRGRGYDTSLGYFYHENDYWNFTVDDNGGAGPQSCATTQENQGIVDLWMANETYEGPAIGFNNSIAQCSPPGDNAYPADESVCQYEDFLFARHVRQLAHEHGQNHKDKPFFLCWAPHIAHEPLQVPQAYDKNFSHIDLQQRRLYAAMVYLLDQQIGNLVNDLKKLNMWDNTLFVFSSDNGGPIYRFGTPGANNFPLRGGKASNHEGGIRVPAFASGGAIPQSERGTKKTGLAALWDWYATFAAVAGVDPSDERAAKAGLPAHDSVNLWPYLSGETNTPPRSDLVLGTPSGWRAVWNGPKASVNGILVDRGTDGLWKLLVNEVPMAVWTGPTFPNTTDPADWTHSPENVWAHCGEGCLFAIDADESETTDLASLYPDIVAELKSKAAHANTTVFSPYRGKAHRSCCGHAQTTNKNFWGPFLDIPATLPERGVQPVSTVI